jgi:hypothetical protein
MTEEKPDLVKRAETALAELTLREPDFEALVQRIEGALATPIDEPALLVAPLPATDGEGAMEAPITAPAGDSVPSPRDSGVIVRSSDSAGSTLSTAPASFDEVDDDWASKPDATDSAAGVEAVLAEAEDLTAHAATDDSSPFASARRAKAKREPVSLADLARASVARRGSAEAANIAKESLAVASQSRAQGEQIAQRVQAAVSQPEHAQASVRPPAPSARNVSTIPPARPRGGDILRGPWPGIAIAVVALAASFALYLSRPEPQPITIVQPAAEPAAAQRIEAPRSNQPVSNAATPEPAREAALDPSSLPALPREAAAPQGDGKSVGTVAKTPAAMPAAAPAPAAPGKVAAEKIVLEEEQKPAPKTAASAPAARPGDAKLRPAELSSETMTDRPSAGAAQAAVGAVLGAARTCVAGHPQPSSAQLVFGSDGQVASVTVGGPAAGTPAGACIESALKKARVQPFAASSFSLGVTVRPP